MNTFPWRRTRRHLSMRHCATTPQFAALGAYRSRVLAPTTGLPILKTPGAPLPKIYVQFPQKLTSTIPPKCLAKFPTSRTWVLHLWIGHCSCGCEGNFGGRKLIFFSANSSSRSADERMLHVRLKLDPRYLPSMSAKLAIIWMHFEGELLQEWCEDEDEDTWEFGD